MAQVRLACITGPNGAGKSTLLTAVSFAIFGLTRTGDMDEVVTEGEDRAEVALIFEHDGERYRITRTRQRGGKTTAVLERDSPDGWSPVGDKGPKAVAVELDRMLGISAETYSSTVLLAQEDSGRFSKADPAARKKILSEILSLERYAKLAKAARDRATDAKRSHEELQRRIDEIDAEIADAAMLADDLSDVDTRLGELAQSQAEAEQEFSEAQAAVAKAEASRQRLDSLHAQITSAERAAEERRAIAQGERVAALERHARAERAVRDVKARLEKARCAARDLASVEERLELLRTALSESVADEQRVIEEGQTIRANLDRTADDLARAKKAISEAAERKRALSHEGAECFACHQSLDADLRDRLHAEVEHEIERLQEEAESLSAKSTELGERRNTLMERLGRIRKARPAAKAVEALERQLAEARAAADSLADQESALASATETFDAAVMALSAAETEVAGEEDPVLARLRAEAEEAERSTASVAFAEQRRDAVRELLRSIASEREQLTQRKGRLSERLSHYDKLRTERMERTAKAETCAKDREDWAGLAKAYGPDGVPNLVFTGVVAELERDASGLMEELTNGTMRLALRTSVQNKSDDSVRETLDVIVITPAGERRYQALSGGERFRVDLALRVALARLLARRSGSAIDFLALDEGWGSLDPEGINAMLDALRQLHTEFGLILTVTHTPEVAAAFEARLEVERDSDGTSVVRLVAA